jgi:hypothetical protein
LTGRSWWRPYLFAHFSSEVQSVRFATQPQLHTRSAERGEPVRLVAGLCSTSDTRSRAALGYLGFCRFADTWSMSQLLSVAATAPDAVSNPTECQLSPVIGGSQVRLRTEAEGSFPSPAAEQISGSAPLFYSDRVVSETSESATTRTSVSRPLHAAPGRWSGTRCARARAPVS